jgi:2-hydroxy-6-oxonona-2,4-dienedioate hydrolase
MLLAAACMAQQELEEVRRAEGSFEEGSRPRGRIESDWSTVDGCRIHVRRSVESPSDAPAVVLVHGIGVSSSYFIPIASVLAPHVRVYAPDLPGFGESWKPDRTLLLHELGHWLGRWIEVEGLAPATLLGQSFGCQVIADLAVRRPARIDRLILQGPTGDPRAQTLRHQLWRWAQGVGKEPDSLSNITQADYGKAGMRRVLRTFLNSLHDHLERKLPRIAAPTLVVRGADDVIVPQEWAERAAGMLPNGRVAVVPGGLHAINYSGPVRFADAILPFILEVKPSPTTGRRPAPRGRRSR